MTAYLHSPHRSVRLLALSQSVLFKSRWHASFHLVFGRPIFLSLVYPFSILSSICVLHLSSSHARTGSIVSMIFLEAHVTRFSSDVFVPDLVFACHSTVSALHIHRSILILFTTICCSCLFIVSRISAP